MNKRDSIRDVFSGKVPAYVPWHYSFTQEPWNEAPLQNILTFIDEAKKARA